MTIERATRWAVVMAALFGGATARAEGAEGAEGATKPAAAATKTSAAAPSTVDAGAASGKTHVVARGVLLVAVEGDATLEAIDAFEVRVRPKAYSGDLTVVAAAENGTLVRKGDPLLQLDAGNLKREVQAAENDLALARATARKAEADVRLGAAADKIALDAATQESNNATANLHWLDEVDAPHALKMADLQLREFKDGIDDQQDELNELKKMYKSEELTSATADIVIKRAVRKLDRTREVTPVAEAAARKVKELSNPQARATAESAAARARVTLDQLKVAQEQGKVARETANAAAALVVARAEQKLGELRGDIEQMTVAAPTDGVVYHGAMQAGAWQAPPGKSLRPGEKAPPQQALLTLIEPGKLRAVIAVPEAKLAAVRLGMKARVSPKLLPELKYAGTVSQIARTPGPRGGATGYDVQVDLPALDARLGPAMTAGVKLEPEKFDGLLLIPAGAVANGKVTVRAGGMDEEREVTVGRTDGKSVEIVSGVAEGDVVVLK